MVELILSAGITEFATVSGGGVPIDTPTISCAADDLSEISVATGLAYPAKAERARRNPKVGLLIEGDGPKEPVVSIAGMAAVRDSDIQANASRYLTEISAESVTVPWSVARQAVWCWCRIFISVTPVRVCWWPDKAAMAEPPNVWLAPEGTPFPASDPAAPGAISIAPQWAQPAWPKLVVSAIASGMPAHLTLLDDEGFPLPFRVTDIEPTEEGFVFRSPAGAPWNPAGKATLSFEGRVLSWGR